MRSSAYEASSAIVHVGLGKTGTTTLQSVVFPALARRGYVTSFNPRKLLMDLVAHLREGAPAPAVTQSASAPVPGPLVSFESLAGWNPAHWPEHAAMTAGIFPSASTILITLRDPESYLRSVYQQLVSIGNVAPPRRIILCEDDFLRTARFSRTRLGETFNVDRLDYQALVDLFASRFKKVIVVPMNCLAELRFVTEICELSELDLAECRRLLTSARPRNPSYSAFGMALTQRRERVLAALGLKSLGSHDEFLYLGTTPIHFPRWRRLLNVATRWSTFVKALDRLGPGLWPYRLPADVPRGRHFEANRRFIAQLEAEPCGYRVIRGSLNAHSASSTDTASSQVDVA